MKSAFHTGVRTVTIRETPKPVPGPGQYLVRIKACAICGSDTWWNNPAADSEPVHGHESAGIVEACGPGADRYRVGDRVVCYAIKGCGSCESCKAGIPTRCNATQFVEGGFQEYSLFPAELLFPCPEGVDFVTASLLSDAIGVPLRGLRRLPPAATDAVTVWGLGPLGLLQVMFLKAKGVRKIIGIDTVEARRNKALELGADHALDPREGDAVAEIARLCGGGGADKAYTFVRNAQATETVFKSTKKGGEICTYVGLEGNFNLPEWMERTLVWSFYFTPAEYPENVRFIAEHGIDLARVVSDVFPLEAINAAFAKRFADPEHSTKIVIAMD